MPYVVTSDCNLCGACVSGCETGAVQEGENQAIIDVTICVECGVCAANCPFGAIVFTEDPRSPSSEIRGQAGVTGDPGPEQG